MAARVRRRKNKLVLWIVSVTLLLFLVPALTVLTIFLRYRASEKAIGEQPPLIMENAWYYNGLTRKEQLLYEAILAGIETMSTQTELLPYRYSEKEFTRVSEAIDRDCPKLFYLDVPAFVCCTDGFKSYAELAYRFTSEELAQRTMELEAIAAAASAYATACESEFDKEVALHDFLVGIAVYEGGTADTAASAYDALVKKQAGSLGYAKALKLLFDRNGIESIIVEGRAAGERHHWNIVSIDGQHTHLDASWNDGDIERVNVPFHGYFNLTDSEMSLDHTLSGGWKWPACTENINYYTLKGLRTASISQLETIAYDRIRDTMAKGESFLEVYPEFSTESDAIRLLMLDAVDRLRAEGVDLLRAIRVYECSQTNAAMTIQIFYNSDKPALPSAGDSENSGS
ncbi:MAG: hypothetical protein E7655_05140 [Ruminococcaceae bacterium]|nr:hypothetical protein [Oscillospiraceae bacterium]